MTFSNWCCFCVKGTIVIFLPYSCSFSSFLLFVIVLLCVQGEGGREEGEGGRGQGEGGRGSPGHIAMFVVLFIVFFFLFLYFPSEDCLCLVFPFLYTGFLGLALVSFLCCGSFSFFAFPSCCGCPSFPVRWDFLSFKNALGVIGKRFYFLLLFAFVHGSNVCFIVFCALFLFPLFLFS